MGKHYFNAILNLVLSERENRCDKIATVVWQRKVAKKVENFFTDKYIEDINESTLNHFFQQIRFKQNGQLLSDKYIKSITSLI